MNTERTKNVLIALLSVIAVSLGALIFVTEGRYTLSAGQEADIRAILQRDDIYLRGDVSLPRDFYPARQMGMRRYNYDLDGLAARFFGDDGFVVEIAYPTYSFTHPNHDEGMSMVYNFWFNTVTFSIPQGISNEAFEAMANERAAELLVTQYIESVIDLPPNMQHYSTTISYHGNWVVDFFTVYRDFVLQNDRIRAHVSENGIVSIEYSRVEYDGFIGDARNIFPPNEALMALMNEMRIIRMVEGTIVINDMRVSYFLTEERGQSVGIPAYLFAVYMGGDRRFNFIFNAYTNELLHFESSP
jgi:hypothetical protein